MSITDIPELENLTVDEKLQIISELWDSANADGLMQWPYGNERKQIIDERLAEMKRNPGSSFTHDDFNRRLAELHAGSASASSTSEA